MKIVLMISMLLKLHQCNDLVLLDNAKGVDMFNVCLSLSSTVGFPFS